VVTGSVKYDGACTGRDNPRTVELRRLFSIGENDLVWVAGSTQAPEEQRVIDIYRKACKTHPNLRLLIVPRHRERFDEVADLLTRADVPFLRRSRLQGPADRQAVILVDTIGELGAVWGLANIAFVGGSLDGKRGGQNMIEPAAYGAAALFGPHTWNFKDTVARLLEHGGAIQVADTAGLEKETLRLLADERARQMLGECARRFVLSQQGATERTLEALTGFCRLTSRQAA
jgi:3-deoxy-D-manno-octulosonic-acid transferase